ncbi:MAG: ankyrin repeat domain-containing protein [Actinobacteria bacterium]|nr:ankyrin repeat domain-containing protein [Actinomycetota bacterium]
MGTAGRPRLIQASRNELIVAAVIVVVLVCGAVVVVVNASRSTPLNAGERRCQSSRSDLVRNAHAGRVAEVRAQLGGTVEANAADEAGFRPLYCAMAAGNREVAVVLLDGGADPNLVSATNDSTKSNALNIAVTTNRPDLVTLLLDRKADPNGVTDGHAPLNDAIEKQLPEMASLLLERGSDPNRPDSHGSPLVYAAAQAPDARIPKLLLEHGADANAASDGYGTLCLDLAQSDMGSSACRTPIGAAAMAGRLDTVRVLLDRGADPSAGVYGASTSNRPDIVRVLERGASPNPKSTTSPLLYNVIFNNTETITLLVEHGADVNRGGPANSSTLRAGVVLLPQMGPASGDKGAGLKSVVCALQGSATNLPPLVAAAAIGDLRVVTMLLDYGADPNAVADFTSPISAVSAARAAQRDDVTQLLLSRGAKADEPTATVPSAVATTGLPGC